MTETLIKLTVMPTERLLDTIQFYTLDETRYGFRFRYMRVDQRWRMWILALDGEQVAGPVKLVPGIDLLHGHKHDPRIPQGELFCYSDARVAPDKTNIDSVVSLLYRPPAAVDAAIILRDIEAPLS